MRVKGTALLSRKQIVVRKFGDGAWQRLTQDMAQSHPFFASPVVASSLIPLSAFLAFHDELIRRFYRGNQKAYFELGEDSARWALTEGPYKAFVASGDVARFVESFPRLWDTYLLETTSWCKVELDGDVVELQAFELPQWHPYFEYFIAGYLHGALELLCGETVTMTALAGGGKQYHYRFRMPRRFGRVTAISIR